MRGEILYMPGKRVRFFTYSTGEGYFYATGSVIEVSNNCHYCFVKVDDEFSIKRRIDDVLTELKEVKVPKSNTTIIGD